MNSDRTTFHLSAPMIAGCGAVVLFSGGAFLVGAFWEPQRVWANLLVVSYYLLGLGLGAALLLALLTLTGARWSTLIQPILKKMAGLLPAGAAGLAVVLLARPSLYPWTNANDSGSSFQVFWLSRPFFLLRSFVYLALLLAMTSLVVRSTRPQQLGNSARNTRISAGFLVVFAFTCWLASTDWIMSLEPRWSSAVFAVYNFSGMFLGTLAAVVVLAICSEHQGTLGGRLTKDQLRDLGTLLFAFSSFWMYIWFSQYMLIWYVNNPEEAEYFVLRKNEPWGPLFLANLVVNWGVPFVILLFRRAKESPAILLLVAGTVLAGRFLDIYLMVLPPVARDGPVFGLWDACLIPGTIGVAVLVFSRNSKTALSFLH